MRTQKEEYQANLEYNIKRVNSLAYVEKLKKAAPLCSKNWGSTSSAVNQLCEVAGISFNDVYKNEQQEQSPFHALYSVAVSLADIHGLCR